jgi:hypothetical protein
MLVGTNWLNTPLQHCGGRQQLVPLVRGCRIDALQLLKAAQRE